MFDNIVWSEQPCTLKEFIETYPLPQLVKVEDGLYSTEDAETLSKDDILTLHFTKQTDKLLVEAADHKRYFVPINCPCKIELLPKICQDRYYSVEDVVDAWTSTDFNFIRVVHNGPPHLRIRAGDILKLRTTGEEKRVKFLECEFHDETKDFVRLPLDFKAAFEPLARAEQYHLQEFVKKLPVRVKFTSCDTTIQGANDINVDLPSLGSVLLKEFREERTVIATSRHDNLVTVLMIPAHLDVHVIPARGAVLGDKEYARFCKDIHDGTELTKVDLSNPDSIMLEEPTVDVIYDYAEVKPLLPRRKRLESNQSDNSYSSEDYEDIDRPPPIPPRRTTLNPKPIAPFDVCLDAERSPKPPKPPPKPKPKPKSPKPKPLPMSLNPVSQYENMQYKAPIEKPLEFWQASPRDFDGGNDDNVDDDDDDEAYSYFSSDEDYIYPEIDEPEWNKSSYDKLVSPKEQPEASERRKKPTIKEKFFKQLKKVVPKSPPAPPSPSISSRTAAGPELLQSFPDDLGKLSVSKVSECLRMLNMDEHVETFESEQIDGELFIMLNADTLPYLGVSNKFQQQKLLKFIQGWRPVRNNQL